VENKAHYCDITGEPQFILKTRQEFDKAAQANGVRIVHCCGFDSVPSEVMTLQAAHYMKEKHGMLLGEVTGYLIDISTRLCAPQSARCLSSNDFFLSVSMVLTVRLQPVFTCALTLGMICGRISQITSSACWEHKAFQVHSVLELQIGVLRFDKELALLSLTLSNELRCIKIDHMFNVWQL
jgi:hypothetical protein